MRRAVLAVVAVTALAAMGVAQAAGLDVSAGSITPFEPATACTAETVEVAPGDVDRRGVAESVVVVVPEDCAGVPGRLSLVEAAGAREVTLTATAGPTTVAVDPYPAGDVAGTALVLAGWGVPTAWSYTPVPLLPVYPGNDVTITSEPRWTVDGPEPVQACVAVDVTTDSPTPVEWRVELDLDLPPFHGQAERYSLSGDDAWAQQLYPATPSAGHLQVGGDPAQERSDLIQAGQTRTVEICNWGLVAIDQPDAYTVTTEPVGTWTDNRACVATTVQGNGTSQFWFAWSTTVDLQPAVDHLRVSPHGAVWYEWGEGSWQIHRTPDRSTGPHAWLVTASPSATLQGTQGFTFQVCARAS